jgi:selenocysteine lyase/cysteine desulfurase
LKLLDVFPATNREVYFNSGVMGLLPESTIKVIEDFNRDLVTGFKGEKVEMEEWNKRLGNVKERFAAVIGSTVDEVAMTPNATAGINTAMNMIPIEKGDNIVTTNLEFPMGAVVVGAQKRKGAEARYIKGKKGVVETSDFEKHVDDDTKVIYVDHAGWFNGLLFDIKALADLAHDHGAYLVVDATQTMGVLDWKIKETGVDFAATSTYKWLMGGSWAMSMGFLYANKKHVDTLEPLYLSGGGLEKTGEDDHGSYVDYLYKSRHSTRAMEIYRMADVSKIAVEHSMGVLLDHGMAEIESYVKKLDTRLIDGLLERGYELQTPLEENRRIFLNVVTPDPGDTVKKLASEGIVVSGRVGGVRISPHFYNTIEEVDHFFKAWDKIC